MGESKSGLAGKEVLGAGRDGEFLKYKLAKEVIDKLTFESGEDASHMDILERVYQAERTASERP